MKRTRSFRAAEASRAGAAKKVTGKGVSDNGGEGKQTVVLMDGVILCCTGVTVDVKNELREKVEAMGGSFDVSLTMDTTHLVAACVDTEKYNCVTAMESVVVVRPEWVMDTWREGRKLSCANYALLPFEGLHVTITGLSSGRKAELRAMILGGGGQYMGAMEASRTTHLVAEVASGAKYEAATSPDWRKTITIVHSRWVEECYRRMLLLPEEEFPVTLLEEKTEPEDADGDDGDNDDDDFQVQPQEKPLHQGKGAQHEEAETADTLRTELNRARPATAARLATSTAEGSTTDRSLYPWAPAPSEGRGVGRSEGGLGTEENGVRTAEGVPTNAEALALPDGEYLSGCRIMLVGFSAEGLRSLALLIRKGCGIRYTFPNEEITHVVLGDRDLARMEIVSALESHPCTPPVVAASWLLGTCRAGRILPTESYLHTTSTTGGNTGNRNRPRDGGGSGGGDDGGAGASGGSGRRFGVGANKSRLFGPESSLSGNTQGGGSGDTAGNGGKSAGDPPAKSKSSKAVGGKTGGAIGVVREDWLACSADCAEDGDCVRGQDGWGVSEENQLENDRQVEGKNFEDAGQSAVGFDHDGNIEADADAVTKAPENVPLGALLLTSAVKSSRSKEGSAGLTTDVDSSAAAVGQLTKASVLANEGLRGVLAGDGHGGVRSAGETREKDADSSERIRSNNLFGKRRPGRKRQRTTVEAKDAGSPNSGDASHKFGSGLRKGDSDGGACVPGSSKSGVKSQSAQRRSSMFRGMMFFVNRTGLDEQEEKRAINLIDRHSGQCLYPDDTRSVSALRSALRSVGVDLNTSSATADTTGTSALPISDSDKQSRTIAMTGNKRARFVVVSKHGAETIGPAVCADGGSANGAGGCVKGDNVGSLSRGDGVENSGEDASLSGVRSLPGKGQIWSMLESEGGAEVVTLLWLEACDRVGDARDPDSCESVFRPLPWPLHRLDNNTASSVKVAVTGFVSGERTGWEQMIIGGLATELCKSLRKRVTTHLVCKEARGEKYKTALKWGIEVVTADWLLSCAQYGYTAGMESSYRLAPAGTCGDTPRECVPGPSSADATRPCTLVRDATVRGDAHPVVARHVGDVRADEGESDLEHGERIEHANATAMDAAETALAAAAAAQIAAAVAKAAASVPTKSVAGPAFDVGGMCDGGPGQTVESDNENKTCELRKSQKLATAAVVVPLGGNGYGNDSNHKECLAAVYPDGQQQGNVTHGNIFSGADGVEDDSKATLSTCDGGGDAGSGGCKDEWTSDTTHRTGLEQQLLSMISSDRDGGGVGRAPLQAVFSHRRRLRLPVHAWGSPRPLSANPSVSPTFPTPLSNAAQNGEMGEVAALTYRPRLSSEFAPRSSVSLSTTASSPSSASMTVLEDRLKATVPSTVSSVTSTAASATTSIPAFTPVSTNDDDARCTRNEGEDNHQVPSFTASSTNFPADRVVAIPTAGAVEGNKHADFAQSTREMGNLDEGSSAACRPSLCLPESVRGDFEDFGSSSDERGCLEKSGSTSASPAEASVEDRAGQKTVGVSLDAADTTAACPQGSLFEGQENAQQAKRRKLTPTSDGMQEAQQEQKNHWHQPPRPIKAQRGLLPRDSNSTLSDSRGRNSTEGADGINDSRQRRFEEGKRDRRLTFGSSARDHHHVGSRGGRRSETEISNGSPRSAHSSRRRSAGVFGGDGDRENQIARVEAQRQRHEQRAPQDGIEEESQIVTYGEQYNPATGWIR